MKNILSNEKELKGRKMKPSLIKKGLIAAALGLTLSSGVATAIPVEPAKVEAANKDRKKPKITFKGKTKLTAEEGEKVTIPKTNFSDNATKKKKLKLGVTVKKGKKSYKTIANSIKKATLNNKKTSVAFPEEGTYKITYTVTDLAKNVATKARTVTVTDKEIIEEDTMTPKEDPTTEEQRRVVTTETTTEQKTTEQPKVETPTVDLSKYGKVEKVTVDGNTYNVISNVDRNKAYSIESSAQYKSKSISKWRISNLVYDETKNDYITDHSYLGLYGKISVIDKNGVDCSNNVYVMEYDEFNFKVAAVYCIDSENNFLKIMETNIMTDPNIWVYGEDAVFDESEFNYIDKNKGVYIQGDKGAELSLNDNIKKNNTKILAMKKEWYENV